MNAVNQKRDQMRSMEDNNVDFRNEIFKCCSVACQIALSPLSENTIIVLFRRTKSFKIYDTELCRGVDTAFCYITIIHRSN